MASASAFERQLTLAPPRVLGRCLAPFTLGHAHLLEIAKSPFMGFGGGKCDSSDLIMAVWICSFPRFEKARKVCLKALSGRIPRSVRSWGRRIGPDFPLEREAAALAAFIDASTKAPPAMRRADKKPIVTPAAATLAVLHRHYFYTPAAKVMDVPFLDALLDVIVWHHAQGMAELIDDKKQAFFDAVDKMTPPRRPASKPKART